MDLERHEWLSQSNEIALDPHREIIDAHHHLWERGGSRYLAEELNADTSLTHNITKTVFVECKANYLQNELGELRSLGETIFVASEAERLKEISDTSIGAIVGFIDMSLGEEIAEIIESHVEAANGLFRGVRHATGWSEDSNIGNSHTNPSKGIMGNPEFIKGVQTLSDAGYSFDAWLYFDQLNELVELAERVPNAKIILNHLGGPLGIGKWNSKFQDVDTRWQESMLALSELRNVYLKLGGIGMDNYFGTGWAARDKPPSSEEVADFWRDKITRCIEYFGPSQCMFESNYPVDRQTLPYPVLWNAFQIIASGYSNSEQDQLFSTTAKTVYKIEDTET
ncbi:MAG: amidohydrolase family protein [Acidimicrobiales bacterium]|jgi:predicted TIM-barrel fold metal-dependent hydrolase|nr:amidohydrolase family protein [Acidimicrobiales bacterium]